MQHLCQAQADFLAVEDSPAAEAEEAEAEAGKATSTTFRGNTY